ncbi:hypothetical protein WA1_00515 [Scytonema hofmannii PCC 7110]|uniref:SH3b domain-containing protein n=2 Tax=Scytonema hofmannii TaxID=34078 RepID=A0A139XG62_9CYAN|nr:hypothetical protein WA1_00515 [Scytonema hofmannii PCC 7110]
MVVTFIMKQKNFCDRYSILTALVVFPTTIFATPCFAVNIDKIHSIPFSHPERALQKKQGEYQLAQYSGSCRQVAARSGLYVWQKPTTISSVVALLDYGQEVTIQNRGKNGWVPISAPVKGYVFNTDFLISCQAATPPNQNFCRKVVADAGLVVRRKPSINAARVGVVADGQNVLVAERGRNGWVPISVPLLGYVQSKYLGYCPGGV